MNPYIIPFRWAQNHGVFYSEGKIWYHEHSAIGDAILETLRLFPTAELASLNAVTFPSALSEHYQRAEKSRQMMEEIGTEMGLTDIVNALPQQDLLNSEDDAPVIRLLNALFSEAIQVGASDIHIEPFETSLRVRFRIDGLLREILSPPAALAPVLVSRIKVMAHLDIAEKRLPQDGRISLRLGGRNIDVRVSTLPSGVGERVVMRVLDKNAVSLDLNSLGMTPSLQTLFRGLLAQPHGILLVTGPTGSGKSTTLYAALNSLNSCERNILTVEDPVEYELEGVGQTQVNPRVDMTFSRGLRAILRQDPDVVMIGEIRDSETASIAVQASLTGHLVLSTLHTNTAAGALSRLRDMGLEPFLLASSLTGVLAQRLVRKLCVQCRKPATLSESEKARHPSLIASGHWRANGCDACHKTGYRGRTGIHELLKVTAELRDAISQGADETALVSCVQNNPDSIATLWQDGLLKVAEGITSLEEIYRVTRECDADGV